MKVGREIGRLTCANHSGFTDANTNITTPDVAELPPPPAPIVPVIASPPVSEHFELEEEADEYQMPSEYVTPTTHFTALEGTPTVPTREVDEEHTDELSESESAPVSLNTFPSDLIILLEQLLHHL
jgi:hypothetical protein